MHNLFLAYFVNLYVFGRILAHHQEVQRYVYNNWYLLFWKHRVVPPDDGPR